MQSLQKRTQSKRVFDQPFGDIRPVGICRIDKIDPKFWQPLERPDALIVVGGFTPDSTSSYAHRAEAQSVYFQVATNSEGAGFRCVVLGHCEPHLA
jgi:hypothetical protein